ncbi:MAG: type IV toxin-antitoxin system AbiEi family antitoxin domain-containing protein [Chloroflexi bacterium]|nr:type IV toxin-antitoxin system AbiEi family antitoxin domain-containing protein [Chloroflexota bacterium]
MIFTVEQARQFLGKGIYATNVLGRLEKKGWLRRVERGIYMIIPLEAGPERAWSESALVIAPHLVQPAAIAYWSALHYWHMTEQIPHVVFVQSTGRKHQRQKKVMGIHFRFVTVMNQKFFGVVERTINGRSIYVTDREKTLLDAADRLDLSGGIAQLAQSLRTARDDLDWQKLDQYLNRWPTKSPLKRIGYLVETMGLHLPDRERRLTCWRSSLSSGVVALEPGRDGDTGRIVTRWRLRINVKETWQNGGSRP